WSPRSRAGWSSCGDAAGADLRGGHGRASGSLLGGSTMAKKEFRMHVEGMTCTDCEQHVVRALEGASAADATADFRRGEARFRAAVSVKQETLAKAVE